MTITTTILAAADLATGLGQVAGIMNAISMILFFAALILSGVMFASGRTEYIKFGLVGAGIGGLSWLIVSTMFDAASPAPTGIELIAF